MKNLWSSSKIIETLSCLHRIKLRLCNFHRLFGLSISRTLVQNNCQMHDWFRSYAYLKRGLVKGRIAFTKPPLFQRKRLTVSGNPTFKSYVEGKYKWREIWVFIGSFFQIIHDYTFYMQAQLMRTCLILWSAKRKSQCRQYFFALRFPSINKFKKRDCLCILVHNFVIGLLLLIMDCASTGVQWLSWDYNV